MIRRLRRRHLVLGVSVLATAPMLVALAVLVRTSEPRNAGVPGLGGGARSIPVVGLPVELRLDSAAGAFAFRATGQVRIPDPLLYWAPAAPQDTSIPAGAVLLGSLTTDRFARAPVPLAAVAPGGVFLIWDGGHHRIVASAATGILPEEGTSP